MVISQTQIITDGQIRVCVHSKLTFSLRLHLWETNSLLNTVAGDLRDNKFDVEFAHCYYSTFKFKNDLKFYNILNKMSSSRLFTVVINILCDLSNGFHNENISVGS